MVCTFGDANDVEFWRAKSLPLRQLIAPDGRMLAVDYGAAPFASRDPERANAAHARAGRQVGRAGAPARDRAAGAARQRGVGRRRRAGRRAAPGRAPGQVLREGRAPARVRAHAPVVRAHARHQGRAARAGAADPVAPGAHARALRALGRGLEPGLVREPAALLRRGVPGLVPGARATARSTTRARSSPRPPSCRSIRWRRRRAGYARRSAASRAGSSATPT